MAINFPNSPSVNDIHVSGANRWQWNGSSWTRIGGVNSDSDTINSTNDNSTTTLYPVMVSGTGDQTAKIATTANKNLKFNAAEGDLTVGGDISGINANLTGILTASQYNSITTPGVNVTGVATALQLKGPLTSSGINVTGVSTFSGNLSVGGVLTYEDVKNVDSVGLITARNGAVVKTGTATTALIVEGDARITGILTVGTGSLVITDKDINATGIITGANFKSGTTNVHNVGVEAAGINVLGADTPIGTGATVYNSGLFVGKQGAEFQGVVTASSFKGSGADLTDVISGIGIGTESGIVGYAATIVHFKGPGVSTAYYSATTGVGTVYFQGGGGASVSIAENAPSSPGAGDLWWDSDVGNLQIYYTDANSSQWVTANNSGPQGPQGAQGATGAQGHQGVQGAQGHQGVQGAVGAQGAQGRQGAQGVQGSVGIASLTISTSAPSSPAQGDMWWESDTGNLGLYYNDGNSSQWVNINSGPSGAQGAQGAQGATGAQGHQGVQGSTGSGGAAGAQGAQGVQGAANATTINNNANNRVITGSGTANTLEGEANLTFDGSTLNVVNGGAIIGGSTDADVLVRLDHEDNTGKGELQLNAFGTASVSLVSNFSGSAVSGIPNGAFGLTTPHAKDITICTSGTERLRIQSDGKLIKYGTNINLNSAYIDFSGSISTPSTAAAIFRPADNTLAFSTANAERVRITSDGKVGINETSPDSMLHVRNDNSYAAKFGGQGGGSDYYMEIGQLSSNSSPGLNATGSSAGMLFKIRGSEKARISSAGNFEIFTGGSYGSSPGRLCVGRRNADPGAVTVSIARGEAIGGGTGPLLEFVHGPDGGTQRKHEIYSYVGDLRIFADSNENIEFRGTNTIFKASGGSEYVRIDSNGHFIPGANDTYDLGSSSRRWRDIYTGDLNLSNKGSTNDVDGTWGNYTIQEGENDLFLINNRSGKKYKFNLTEVS